MLVTTCHAHRLTPLSHRRFSPQQHYSSQHHLSTTRRLLSLHAATRTSFHESLRHPQPLAQKLSCLVGRPKHGGYAGILVGEAVHPGPATHERDWTDEQPDSTHKRINEAGDSVTSSQDSVTRAVQNLRISDSSGLHGLTGPASVYCGEHPETPTAEKTAQRVPPLCTVLFRPSCVLCLL